MASLLRSSAIFEAGNNEVNSKQDFLIRSIVSSSINAISLSFTKSATGEREAFTTE